MPNSAILSSLPEVCRQYNVSRLTEKQLQVVKGIISRNSGYARSQAEATERHLTLEITELKKKKTAMAK